MDDGVDFLFGGSKPEPQPTAVGGDGVDFLFGDGQKSAPQQVSSQDLSAGKSLGFWDQAYASFSSDDEEYKRAAAQQLYPDEPLEKAVTRFGRTKDGRLFHTGDDGQHYEVQPSEGLARLANIGSGVGYGIPAATGTVSAIVTAPMMATGVGTAGTIAATGAGAGGGEWLRQRFGDALLGEASTKDLNKGAIATEALTGSVGQGIGKAAGTFLTRQAAPDVGRFSAKIADDIYAKAQRIGVDVTPAEATGLRSQLARQKGLAGSSDEAGNIMGDFQERRGEQVRGAFRGFMDNISPGGDSAYRGQAAKDAAEKTMNMYRKQRTAAVKPFYDEAAKRAGPIDARPILQNIDAALPGAKGSEKTALMRARSFLFRGLGPQKDLETTFEGLDKAKKALDGMLQQSKMGQEAQGLDINARNALQGVKGQIVDLVDNHMVKSPYGAQGPYLKGRSLYKHLTESEVDLAKQALAPLLKANPETASVVRLANAVFNPSGRSPGQVRNARMALEKNFPNEWKAITRDYIQDISSKALKDMTDGTAGNAAGRLNKLFDSDQKAILKQALTKRQFKDLEDMLDVFKAVSKSFDGNSDTAFKRQEIKNQMRENMGIVARGIEYAIPWEKVAAARNFFATRSYQKKSEMIARLITQGDRKAMAQLKSLKKMNDSDWRKWALFGQIASRGGVLLGKATLEASSDD